MSEMASSHKTNRAVNSVVTASSAVPLPMSSATCDLHTSKFLRNDVFREKLSFLPRHGIVQGRKKGYGLLCLNYQEERK